MMVQVSADTIPSALLEHFTPQGSELEGIPELPIGLMKVGDAPSFAPP